ncbi:hypothetical protein MBM_02277 [Drepanopeziza brunnea f. sp. 'multigermtubi' MB_m1]|uniref:Uncharacterized protein n=1 Tax=Marssonina brunnea f. sp. multigermtubi (strain MB_m1) TaxID=1072389 RepID=K1WMV7_MARBU|nr:uncharacterized protein MBM_02277 [Drepanopeziza brunnea f. sp. 'multigermtubi' MB_m1]EKD19040.1 hypothetical protein MBM_02277 [Drepanopeziza brunnea f. sp. 'multigermtubi' MB_m1]
MIETPTYRRFVARGCLGMLRRYRSTGEHLCVPVPRTPYPVKLLAELTRSCVKRRRGEEEEEEEEEEKSKGKGKGKGKKTSVILLISLYRSTCSLDSLNSLNSLNSLDSLDSLNSLNPLAQLTPLTLITAYAHQTYGNTYTHTRGQGRVKVDFSVVLPAETSPVSWSLRYSESPSTTGMIPDSVPFHGLPASSYVTRKER